MGIRCRPVVTQAAVGAGHWAAGRRQRALAAWAWAAGSALAAWGLGTEVPTRAEMVKNTRQHRDQLRELGTRLPPEAPATAGTQAHPPSAIANTVSALASCSQMTFGVRSGLRHPQRLTVGAIASETFYIAFYVLLAARAAQRHRPRIAVGRALSAAGSVARLRAASADLLHRWGTWRRRSWRGYERRNSSRATSRNGTIRYTAIPKYNTTASHGRTSPIRIAITYSITTGRSFRCGPSTSAPSPCGE